MANGKSKLILLTLPETKVYILSPCSLLSFLKRNMPLQELDGIELGLTLSTRDLSSIVCIRIDLRATCSVLSITLSSEKTRFSLPILFLIASLCSVTS
jgi:hypothetical protein